MFLVSYLLFIFHPTLPGTFIYFIYVFALENFSTWYSSSVNYSLSISMPYSSHGYSCLMLPVVPIFSGIIFMLNFWSSLFFFSLVWIDQPFIYLFHDCGNFLPVNSYFPVASTLAGNLYTKGRFQNFGPQFCSSSWLEVSMCVCVHVGVYVGGVLYEVCIDQSHD